MRAGYFSWRFWPIVPLYPYSKRRTLRREVLKDTIWTFDQLQGILYVTVPIRMTVVKLEQGGLLVYAPIAPTPECLHLMQELTAAHGDVKYIVLPTISGIEHKVFVGPFARQFPSAQVFVAPNQWSFPLNLPLSWLGLPTKRTQVLPPDSSQVPFADEFDYAILGPIYLGPGTFEEVVFFHRRSHTLLVTDAVISVPATPPEILQLNPYPLLFHAKDSPSDEIKDSFANRCKGWQRTALLALYFQPDTLNVIPWGQAFREAAQAPDRSKAAFFGVFPFHWQEGWNQAFEQLRGNGQPLVAPILQALILNRAPIETIRWVNQVANWDFQRIVSAHFDSPIAATPTEFRTAFNFLQTFPTQTDSDGVHSSPALPEKDFLFLNQIDQTLTKWKLLPPRKLEREEGVRG
ncbi:DUF4336 domain-containing protein (plasmid) [Kovacikia minuta CCNUW1]|uniref:DUF4336 domain-containing protein n=1 Tax=Kovacikia minuta TaxID=2931930 RepID=UPI001CCA511B|nr:DUF4336 domain-containing protein [Kovacikia minuta]UBF30359.1 DUF4336 domain-containing protein [Kovacikia minuta CCNUW1]